MTETHEDDHRESGIWPRVVPRCGRLRRGRRLSHCHVPSGHHGQQIIRTLRRQSRQGRAGRRLAPEETPRCDWNCRRGSWLSCIGCQSRTRRDGSRIRRGGSRIRRGGSGELGCGRGFGRRLGDRVGENGILDGDGSNGDGRTAVVYDEGVACEESVDDGGRIVEHLRVVVVCERSDVAGVDSHQFLVAQRRRCLVLT